MDDTRETRWLSAEEQRTWLAVREFTWGFQAAMDRQLARDSGLGAGEYSVLATLSDNPEGRKRSGDVACDLGWERSRLSHLLRRMEAKDLVGRCSSEADGRGQDVFLTEHGWAVLRAAAPGHVTFVRETVFDPLTPQEQETLRSAMERIRDAMDQRGLW